MEGPSAEALVLAEAEAATTTVSVEAAEASAVAVLQTIGRSTIAPIASRISGEGSIKPSPFFYT